MTRQTEIHALWSHSWGTVFPTGKYTLVQWQFWPDLLDGAVCNKQLPASLMLIPPSHSSCLFLYKTMHRRLATSGNQPVTLLRLVVRGPLPPNFSPPHTNDQLWLTSTPYGALLQKGAQGPCRQQMAPVPALLTLPTFLFIQQNYFENPIIVCFGCISRGIQAYASQVFKKKWVLRVQ